MTGVPLWATILLTKPLRWSRTLYELSVRLPLLSWIRRRIASAGLYSWARSDRLDDALFCCKSTLKALPSCQPLLLVNTLARALVSPVALHSTGMPGPWLIKVQDVLVVAVRLPRSLLVLLKADESPALSK